MPSVPPSEDKEAVQIDLPCFFPLLLTKKEQIPGELLLRPTVTVVIPHPAPAAAFK